MAPFIERISFGDGEGNLSFNKLVTAVMVALFAIMIINRINPAWSVLSFGIVIVGAGFGLKGFMAALARQTTNATIAESVAITGDAAKIIEAVKARRDVASGTEDSGRVPQVHHE